MKKEMSRVDAGTGEILANMEHGTTLAVQLAQVELNQAVTTARAFPRSLQTVRDNINALVMLDAVTAGECIYAVPRGGKAIKGPSVRFAEIVASQYGNCHVGSRVVEVNRFEKYVEAEGVFHDLESGMKRTARVRRRIVDSQGRLYNDDMVVTTGNAACSIALREAVIKGVPKALWRAAYEAAEAVIAGDVKTLSKRRDEAVKAFAHYGVTPDQIFASLEIAGLDEVGLPEIGTLTAMYVAIRDGEHKVEDYFPAKIDKAAGVTAAKGTAAKLAAIADAGGGDPKAPADSGKGKGAGTDKGAKAADVAAPEDDKEAASPDEDDGSDGDDESAVSDADVAAARTRGETARRQGMPQKACPADCRGNQRLFDAWNEGWEAEGGTA